MFPKVKEVQRATKMFRESSLILCREEIKNSIERGAAKGDSSTFVLIKPYNQSQLVSELKDAGYTAEWMARAGGIRIAW